MAFLIFALTCLCVFMMALLIAAAVLHFRSSDTSSLYGLYAARDALIGAVVFGGVNRDDPWFSNLYGRTNRILRGMSCITGPQKWKHAIEAGQISGANGQPEAQERLPSCTAPPPQFDPIIQQIEAGLDLLLATHVGWHLFCSAEARSKVKLQRRHAREFKKALRDAALSRGVAAPA
jgi:hypothetical protein